MSAMKLPTTPNPIITYAFLHLANALIASELSSLLPLLDGVWRLTNPRRLLQTQICNVPSMPRVFIYLFSVFKAFTFYKQVLANCDAWVFFPLHLTNSGLCVSPSQCLRKTITITWEDHHLNIESHKTSEGVGNRWQ